MPIGSTIVYNAGDLILSTVSSSGNTFQENKIAAATSSIILFNSNGLISSQSLNATTVGTASSLVSTGSYFITNLTASNISASGTISASVFNGPLTGSTFGTASWATNTATASSVASTSNAFIQGGNSFGTTATLGTNDANSLVLETNNTTRLTIDNGGRIAIGSSVNPSYKLSITDTHATSDASASIYVVTNQSQLTANGANDVGIYSIYNVNDVTSSTALQNQAMYNSLLFLASGSYSGSYKALRNGITLSNTCSADANATIINTHLTNQFGSNISFSVATWYAGTQTYIDTTSNNATGSISSLVHHFLGTPFSGVGSGSVTVTNSFGIYIARQKQTNVTNGYGIYQVDSNDKNIFVGKTRIGGTTAPVNTLDVTGNISASTITASLFSGSHTGSTFGTASWADNSLTAITSSYFSGSVLSSSNAFVSGTLFVNGQIVATELSSSTIYITSSALIIGDNVITLNAANPALRYAGIEMSDSGSNTLSSFLWDSQNNYFFVSSSDATASRQVILGPLGEASLTPNYIPLISGSNHITTSVMYQTAVGNIGIGTTSPIGKLNITSSDGPYVFAVAGNTKAVRFNPGSTYTLIQGVDNTLTTTYQPLGLGGSYLVFQTNGAVEAVRIDSTGSVGIGTTNPANKLDVAGNISCSAITASALTASNINVIQSVGIGSTLTVGSSMTVNGSSTFNNLVTINSNLSASGTVSASVFNGPLTGSTFGTASWATNVVSAQTASYLTTANSYQVTNLTASNISASNSFSASNVFIVNTFVYQEAMATGSLTSPDLYFSSSAQTGSDVLFKIEVGALTGSAVGIQIVATGSQESYAISASLGTIIGTIFSGSIFSGSFTGSTFGTASWATNVVSAQTASYLTTANSYRITNLTASNISASGTISASVFSGPHTGSLFGTSSVATSALTAGLSLTSNALNTAGSYTMAGLTVNGNISASGNISGSTGRIVNAFSVGSTLTVTGAITASGNISASGTVSASVFSGPLTGSTFGTASWATTASRLIGGTTNYIPLWTSTTAQGSSIISQSGTIVSLNGGLNVTQGITSSIYTGSIFIESINTISSSDTSAIDLRYGLTQMQLSQSVNLLQHTNTNNGLLKWMLATVGTGTAVTIAWPTGYKWPNGTPPTLTTTAGKRDLYQFVSYDGANSSSGFIFATVLGQNM